VVELPATSAATGMCIHPGTLLCLGILHIEGIHAISNGFAVGIVYGSINWIRSSEISFVVALAQALAYEATGIPSLDPLEHIRYGMKSLSCLAS
jgi:hypothetical protein